MSAPVPTEAQAVAGAGRSLALGREEVAAEATRGGAEAVAMFASPHCTEAEKAELAEYWLGLQAQAAGGTTAA